MTILENVLTRAANIAQRAPLNSGAGRYLQTEGGLTYLSPNIAGPIVDESTANTISAVYRATEIIASTIGALETTVEERKGVRERIPVFDPREAYLWERPNPEVPKSVFWETVIGHEVSSGDAFIYVVKNLLNDPLELWPIDPNRVRVGRDRSGTKVYEVDRGELITVDFVAGGEMVHVPAFSRDGLRGMSRIKLAAQSLGILKAAEEHAARFFTEGTTLSGVLQTDAVLTQELADQYSSRWQKFHAGSANAHRPAILDRSMKWVPTSVNPEDAQLLETRKFQKTDVATWFGLPPYLLADVEKSTTWGSGIEEQGRNFVTFTLRNHIGRFEQTISDELLKPRRRFFRFNTDPLERGGAKERAETYQALRMAGAFTINDILRREGMDPIGPEGDLHLNPLNMTTAEGGNEPTLIEKVNALGALVRAGFEAEAACTAVGLNSIAHTGLVPVTVQPEQLPVGAKPAA